MKASSHRPEVAHGAAAALLDLGAFHHHQPGAAGGVAPRIHQVPVGREAARRGILVHRRHDDAVLQGHAPDLHRREQQWAGHSAFLPLGPTMLQRQAGVGRRWRATQRAGGAKLAWQVPVPLLGGTGPVPPRRAAATTPHRRRGMEDPGMTAAAIAPKPREFMHLATRSDARGAPRGLHMPCCSAAVRWSRSRRGCWCCRRCCCSASCRRRSSPRSTRPPTTPPSDRAAPTRWSDGWSRCRGCTTGTSTSSSTSSITSTPRTPGAIRRPIPARRRRWPATGFG